MKLFIGGLSWNTNDQSLRTKFEEFGQVEDAVVIKDRESGRSRGFGFVTFTNDNEAESALKNMNETEFEGRTIRVDKAGDRPEGGSRPSGGRSGGYGGSGGYRSGGSRYGDRSYGSGDRTERSYGGSSGGDRSYGGSRSYGGRSGDRADRPRRDYDDN